MKILVTGGTGFIGKAMVKRLVGDGHSVAALSRNPPSASDSVTWFRADVTDVESLKAAFSHPYDWLFHLAGLLSIDGRERQRLHAVNVEGTRNVMNAALRGEVGRVVHVSSVAAIGPLRDGAIADETTPFRWNPSKFPYHASKYEGEQVALANAKMGLRVVVVNPAFVFGEGDNHTPAVELLRKLKRRKVPMYPPGGMCAVYLSDVVDGILWAAEKGMSGERYILGGDNLPNRDAYPIITECLKGLKPRFSIPIWGLYVYGFLAELEGYVRRRTPRYSLMWARDSVHEHFYSSAKAKRDLGYCSTPFRAMMEQTIQALQREGLL